MKFTEKVKHADSIVIQLSTTRSRSFVDLLKPLCDIPRPKQDAIMPENKRLQNTIAALGVVWCAAVASFYYINNAGYYREKISVFGNFILKYIELN